MNLNRDEGVKNREESRLKGFGSDALIDALSGLSGPLKTTHEKPAKSQESGSRHRQSHLIQAEDAAAAAKDSADDRSHHGVTSHQ